ncbi:hypothetical protein EXIGLDRAFT_636953 [Exidia glandulosa HHB12029]|uniref:chitinase n=1 Tax=Exidia glandulosa HHB12029 TaxID=1314781 RepID=A0A165Q016_EXIGL|nr:hypothetical protein EXIGLDRAFT_636953 [Exidia glandulosa HHB12029]
MFSKSSLLSYVTLALGASSAIAASIPQRRAQEEYQLSRRADTNGYVSIGYFVNWGIYARNFQPADIKVDELTHILYSFADVDPTSGEIKLTDTYADTDKHYPDDSWDTNGTSVYGCFKQLYGLKLKNRHLKVILSVGGWTYSLAKHFDFVTNEAARATFVSSAVTMLEDYGLDGIDIDFEFPEPEQKEAFGKLIVELRTAFDAYQKGKGDDVPYLISAAVSAGPDHYVNYDIKAMDAPISFWNLMAYDYAGSWSNYSADQANLYNGETTGFNTDQAIKYFLGEGATPGKISLGMPIYGRSFEKTAGIYQPYDGIGTADQSGGSWEAGTWDYKALPRPGAKVIENTTSVASYSYDETLQELITYDTPNIIKMKTEYLVKNKLAGSMWWELSADKQGADSLIATSKAAMGGLDSTPNHVNYPKSKYDNIKNNLGTTPAEPGSAPPSGGGEGPAPSSSEPSAPSSTAAPPPPPSSTEAPPPPPTTSSTPVPTPSPSTCKRK